MGEVSLVGSSIVGSYDSFRGVGNPSRSKVVLDEVSVSLVYEGNYLSGGVV